MQASRHKTIRRYFAASVAAFLGVGLLGPLLSKERQFPGALQGSSARADNQHIVHIDQDVVLFDRPRVVLERGTISLVTPETGGVLSQPEIAERLKAGTAALVLEGGKVLVDQAASPASRATPDAAVKAIVDSLANLSFSTLTTRDLKVTAKRSGTEPFIVGRLSCEIERSASTMHAKGTFERSGISLPFEVTFNTKIAAGRVPVTAKITSELLNADLAGQLLLGDTFVLNAGRAKVSSPHAKDVLGWLIGQPVAGHGLEEFSVSGTLDWSDDTFAFENADVMLDGNEAKGGLSFMLSGARPNLEGTLAFSNLELAPYIRPLPASQPGLTENVLNWSRWMIGDLSSGSLIRDLDADVRVSATSVTSNGAILGRGAATLTLKDSKLLADIAELELEQQGQGDARITVDLANTEPRYEMRGSLEASDLARLSELATGHPLVQGAGQVNVDLTASGNSREEFRNTLAGTATLAMPDGAKLPLDVWSLMASAKTGGLGWGQSVLGSTTVDSLDAKLRASGGLLTATEIELDTSTRRLVASGTLSMADQMLDISLAATPKPAPSSGKDNSEKIRIRGPLLAPIVRPDIPSKAAVAPEAIPQPAPGRRG